MDDLIYVYIDVLMYVYIFNTIPKKIEESVGEDLKKGRRVRR